MEQKIRLGGMALANGVLVSGPTAWAAAVRTADGSVRTATGRVPRFAPLELATPFVRGPVRIAESLALLPAVRAALPEARFSFERKTVVLSIVAGMASAAAIRRSSLAPGVREATAALASLAPAVLSLRGGEVTGYHGAEHVSIGSYESGGTAAKEHERCGSHLVGPLLVTSVLANTAASRAPRSLQGPARLAGAVAALGASVEIFGWMSRHPERRLARALARPGTVLQSRLSTSEPSAEQLEVAEAALTACLDAERAGAAA
ncbi:MAG: DUF1385 domain-containing protein [Gaiella sp.]